MSFSSLSVEPTMTRGGSAVAGRQRNRLVKTDYRRLDRQDSRFGQNRAKST